jgi:hypothetical protein
MLQGLPPPYGSTTNLTLCPDDASLCNRESQVLATTLMQADHQV